MNEEEKDLAPTTALEHSEAEDVAPIQAPPMPIIIGTGTTGLVIGTGMTTMAPFVRSGAVMDGEVLATRQPGLDDDDEWTIPGQNI